jgi:NAD-dependent dihydropyrimidine dehydrogenase PreA subunit
MDFKKIKNIAIYYFSGTGNTLFVSEIFKKNFSLKSISVNLIPIERIEGPQSQSKYDLLVISFPIHAFSAPKMVVDFVNNLPNTSTNKPALLITTCGGMEGDAFSVLRKILLKKNYDVISTFKYKMPDNVSFMFSKDLVSEDELKQRIEYTKEKANKDFENFYQGKREIIKSNLFKNFFSWVVFSFFKSSLKKKKWVVDKDKCTFCSVCENVCPTNNIVVKKQKREVKFSDKCIMCTRCYNLCPENAINYKSDKTKNFKRYNVFKKEIINR